MKIRTWLLAALAPLTAASVMAQAQNPTPSAAAPAPAVSAAPAVESSEPAAKPADESKPKAKKAKAPSVKSRVMLNPPATAIVKADVLDVRGQSSFTGEVITHLKKGESVTVLEEITLGKVRAGEPSQWSRILMPSNTPVWVNAEYIDSGTDAVRVKKVNVRGGPGENYSIVARLDKGTPVKEIRKQAGWLEIETPTNAFAFVASEYLDKQAAAASAPEVAAVPAPQTVVVNVPAETAPAAVAAPAPEPAKPAEATPAAPAPTAASQTEQELAALHKATAPEPVLAVPAATQPDAAKADVPRVVTREGFVHKCYNIQAPADFELRDIQSGELTEYLRPESSKKFKAYVGARVRITGSEFLDPLSPRTPVLQIQTIDLMP